MLVILTAKKYAGRYQEEHPIPRIPSRDLLCNKIPLLLSALHTYIAVSFGRFAGVLSVVPRGFLFLSPELTPTFRIKAEVKCVSLGDSEKVPAITCNSDSYQFTKVKPVISYDNSDFIEPYR